VSFQLTWRGDQVAASVHAAATRGLLKGAEHLRGVAQQLAPIDEGTLRNSAAITVQSAARVAVSFNTPYAVKQHEEVGYRHPKGGQAKYLEEPLHTEADTIRAIAAAELRRSMQ
jgi:hypothetical protein